MAWANKNSSIPLVCTCVPHWGSVNMEWVDRTYGPLRFVPQSDFAKSYKLSRGLANLDTARNALVKSCLEDERVTHILWLDTDMICESPKDPNQALRMLLSCDTDVVSGLYRAKKREGNYPFCMFAKDPKGRTKMGHPGVVPIQKWTGNYISVDMIGMGFCLMKREVFEKIPPPWFVWDKPAPSEDFYFCEKLREYGYSIKVFTEVKLSHGGTMKVKIDGSIHTMEV